MQTVPVVFSTDHNFIMPTGVAIKSLLQHSEDCIAQIYILHSEDVTDNDKMILREICHKHNREISFIYCGDQIKQAFQIRNITTPTYYRLLIPWLIPEFDKIIYCDGDIIFMQSISHIFSFELGDNYIAGVRTGFSESIKGKRYIEHLGLDTNQYINGGIQLINAGKQRSLNLNKIYLDHAKKQYTFQDQDIVNIVCKGHIGLMPLWFNVTPNIADILYKIGSNSDGTFILPDNLTSIDTKIQTNVSNPVIIHYAGTKPWNEFCYYWSVWWDTYRATSFYNPSKELEIEHNTLCKETSVRSVISKHFRKFIPGISTFVDKIRPLKF